MSRNQQDQLFEDYTMARRDFIAGELGLLVPRYVPTTAKSAAKIWVNAGIFKEQESR